MLVPVHDVPNLSVMRLFQLKQIWMFPKIGVPQKGMVYNGKPYEQMDASGVITCNYPDFWETPIYTNIGCFVQGTCH